MRKHCITLLILLIVLTSCSEIPDSIHIHSFETKWTFDSISHWHEPTCGHDVVSGKAEHSWDEGVILVEPTHTAEGRIEHTCTVCGAKKTETLPPYSDAHSFASEWTKDETYHWHVSTCGHDVASGKAEHSWDEGIILVEPTHTEDGRIKHTCTICGATKTETLPPYSDAHTFSLEWTKDETYHWHVSTCGHDVVSGKEEHSWDDGIVIVEPAHTTKGQKEYTCMVCGAVKTEYSPMLIDNHTFSSEWTKDTTNHWHESTCGHDIVSGKAEHSWDDGFVTIEPKHLTEGQKKYSCTVCGLEKMEVIPAELDKHIYPSDWSERVEDGYTVRYKRCEECGFELIYGSEYAIYYNITDDGVLSLKASSDLERKSLPKKMIIPVKIDGIVVRKLDDYTFWACTNLREIEIPDSIKEIGKNAFSDCQRLNSIMVPASVVKMGEAMLYGCTSLETIIVPFIGETITTDSIFGWFFGAQPNSDNNLVPASINEVVVTCATTLSDRVFLGCSSIKRIVIQGSVTNIGHATFYNCSSLKECVLPDSLTDIENQVFENCCCLESITIPNSVTEIGSRTFYGCTSLITVNLPETLTSIDSQLFSDCSALSCITIPESVESIGFEAFSGCKSLSSISFPSSVKTIGSRAFNFCVCLTEISVPDSVSVIGNYAFNGCTRIKTAEIGNVATLGQGVFYGCTSLESISVPFVGEKKDSKSTFGYLFEDESGHNPMPVSLKTVVITHATIIPERAFMNCLSIENVYLGESVRIIGSGSFWNCQKLKTVSFGKNLDTIKDHAFYYCSSLECITIPDGVTKIGKEAFAGCSELKEITLPDTIVEIPAELFLYDSNLKVIYFTGTRAQWESIPGRLSISSSIVVICLGDHEY